MASKYRLCISRCSLVIFHQNKSCARTLNNFPGAKQTACSSYNLLSRKELTSSEGFLNSAGFSTVVACRRRQNALCEMSCSNGDDKQTEVYKPEVVNVMGLGSLGQTRGMAGHSHWQNIKHIKGAKDLQKAAVASKTMNNIVIAVKAGGGDVKLNRELAKALEMGLAQGMQKTRLNEMVEKAVAKSKSYQKQHCFALGPLGCIFVAEVFTDSLNRTKNQLANVIKRAGGQIMNDSGRQAFEEKGIVEVPVTTEMEPVDMDKYLEIAIEAGAEDVILVEEENEEEIKKKILKFHCDPLHVNAVKKEVTAHDLEVASAESDFVPLQWVTLEGTELTVAQNMYQKISEHEDVLRIFDNIHTPDE